MTPSLKNELRTVCNALADAARPIALKHFRQPDIDLQNKLEDGFDPVTIADKAIEAEMRAILAKLRPDDGVLGEEFDNFEGSSGLTWVLDPIDGTRGFISGTPTWGVLIAVSDENGPVLGVIDQPYTAERFFGGFGVAEFSDRDIRHAIKTRSCSDISNATLFTTMPYIGTKLESEAFDRVSAQAKLTRFGTDCYAYALLAAGHVDLVIEAGLNPYDIQGPIAVVENAGGIVTNWQSGPAHLGGQVIAAGDPQVHAQAMALLNG